jgi:hypothetical protein
VIVDLAVKSDEKPTIEGRLWLHAMRRVHDSQAARTHRDAAANHDQRIGNVASVQHALDQALHRRFSAIPADGNRYSAHLAPEIVRPSSLPTH